MRSAPSRRATTAHPSPLHLTLAVENRPRSPSTAGRRHSRMNTLYTAEIADHILNELRAGRSLQDICLEDGMPHRDTVNQWIKQDRDGFAAPYREDRGVHHSAHRTRRC